MKNEEKEELKDTKNEETVNENVESADKRSDEDASTESVKSDKKENDADSVSAETANLKAELEKKEQENASLKDLLLRNKADFDNYRKRVAKNDEQNKKMSVVGIAGEIIKINDDLIRTVEAANAMSEDSTADDIRKTFSEGAGIISKEICSLLARHSICEIESENCPFDPNCHEAVEIDMQEGLETDTVTKVYQKGYKLDEFVIRSAKVKVSKPSPKQ